MLLRLKEVLIELLAVLKLVRALLWDLTVRPRGFGKIVQISEEITLMGQIFTYRQSLLPVPAGVSKQRLVISVDGVEQPELVLAADAKEVDFKAGPVGATVVRTLDYFDAAGNDSDNFVDKFEIVDGVPPAAPAGFGDITQIAEEETV